LIIGRRVDQRLRDVSGSGRESSRLQSLRGDGCFGRPSELASRTTLARFTQAGVIPTSANAVICEVHRTWNRPDAAELAELYTMVSPNYRAVMESYRKAQEVVAKQRDNGRWSLRKRSTETL
jgi:hypothetical protein